MKRLSALFLVCVAFFSSTSQTLTPVAKQGIWIPKAMLDLNYSNNYLFLKAPYATDIENGDINLKLNNAIEANLMGLLTWGARSKSNKLYGGIGVNFSDYSVVRNLYNRNGGGRFTILQSYDPEILNYTFQALRFQFHLDHYAFYKYIMIFQKLGVAHTSFLVEKAALSYDEKYGSSTPQTDPEYVTTDNPQGWHWVESYTTTERNDQGLYKSSLNVFYNFGVGVRIKRITPFAAFEFSNVTSKFASRYLKFQAGINYAFLKK